ncbi:hypothetical protein [Niabella hibiscisoli]|uniref:hypothetical protein n=1 Tax=Niabella hibiscisoli TaxID=1825928 RepID=UPI001F108DAE|nr:hypothetical protein [Niabella hibiscisoli]MCH5716963.1 hypothetical protein [Niabella hibiscisoli]
MSVLEMQLAAIKEITKLEDENALREVLEHLAKISSKEEQKPLNLSQHYNKVKEQYGNVLQKLAQ